MCPGTVCCCAAVLVLLLLLLKCMLGQRRSSRAGVSLPCLPRLPLLGSLLHLRSALPPHLLLTHLSRRYGPLFALYAGPHLTLVVSEPGLAREVLLLRGKEFAGRPKMVTTDVLTQGGKDIAFADYSPLWKSHRRLVHSSFTLFGEGSSKLQTIVLEAADSLCEELGSLRGQRSDLSPVLMRAVTNVICRLVFSSSYQPDDPELLKVMDYNEGIVQTIARGGLVDIFPWLRIFPNKDLKKLKECVSVRDQLLRNKLQEHKMSLTAGEPRDLLDALLIGQMKGSGGDDDITEDHVLMTAAEAFGAGVETTSTTLLWTIAFLLHHTQVQDRVHAELDECVGPDRPPSLSDRSSLPFLDAVVCEVMRIRPVSPILIPHVAMQDTSLGGHTVPKGTRVLVNMWAIHHDPKHWDEPDTFRPERFLDSSGKRTTPASFLPFGAGPRVCVGESLARIELFLFISRLLQRFHFSVPSGASLPDLTGRFGVVLQPQRYTVRVTPRR
ncbi:steroid 17-alpha-hydroxylase/17,20 lyase-like [Pimephales promelas]|uniref:steroid 17-alpha-hydroxylase/17,20 lyase-like n=1 Tax=Pimephales promelas TaxID=90988 RepID=UPI001955D392|nr:steroid 17-alpha-hydroxylase/17,20 lyase-like [Pimephales promelas]XP_039535013.1 steroid 17-alpha-hydroxylase/17,20 lyase-like [Pimephales promelas]XP_039535014.1 steroid 17-alpha-hydroxylase/17,20 lyase-like [Pimephales promelas]XP_039535015.1 steroid 17-alpha-hydroxylase/17,20 lyase-like [Pimephales promelas]KAG1926380.1 steroid 17-alpha-hydroxylase/17,20 lyase [Pimephales promelas]